MGEKVKASLGNLKGPKGRRDDINWDAAEDWYVTGKIIVEKSQQGDLESKRPTHSDIARRFKCSPQLVSIYSRKRSWKQKRELDEEMTERYNKQEMKRAQARSLSEMHVIVDAYLSRFERQLMEDKGQNMTISDLNVAIRLKAFLEKEVAAKPTHVPGAITMDRLRELHRKAMQSERDNPDNAEVAGVLVEESSALH